MGVDQGPFHGITKEVAFRPSSFVLFFMSDSADLNDLYRQWLEIPSDRLPPNHYALLGIDDFESDTSIIDESAKSRSAYLHQIAAGPNRKTVQEMLGQVAVARRTLMNDDSREQYNDNLRAESSRSSGAAPTTTPDHHPSAAATSTGRRRKNNEWKYHLVSATILLSIVGAIYWFNRNSGGRRAAEAKSDVSGTARPTVHNETVSAANAPSKPAVTARRATSPVAQRRNKGSGLGSGLGSQFSDVLSDIDKQSDNKLPGNNPGSSSSGRSGSGGGKENMFRPLGAVTINAPETLDATPKWISNLNAIEASAGDIENHFTCDHGFDWIQPQDQRLVVSKPTDGELPDEIILKAKKNKFTDTSVIALHCSIGPKTSPGSSVAVIVDGYSIGMKSIADGIEIFVRERGAGGVEDSVCKITTDADSCKLAVARDPGPGDSIRWYVAPGNLHRTGTIETGRIKDTYAAIKLRPGSLDEAPFWFGGLEMSTDSK